ncbi:MAG TPA: phosphonate ABC transporter, permease protein PhnE [Acetobacteraceae bacterium]|nr:phosphonate ABC transporter, permease protein PhnE [Acetobacteraceae bacterium]
MSGVLTQLDVAALRALHPQAFGPSLRVRAIRWAGGTGAAVLAALLFGHLGFFDWTMIGTGLVRLGGILGFMLPPGGFDDLDQLLYAVLQTLAMAFAGSVLANIIAVPIGFLAARNVVRSALLHFLLRRVLDAIRGVDVLIWALIFISVVGLGPFAGILAIIVSDTGALAKLYAEAIEAVDRRQREAVQATGASRLQVIRYGIVPQVLPLILSNAIYFFESNTRNATVLGVVGAGGIGLALFDRIGVDDWHSASLVILLILLTVYSIDTLTGGVRRRLTGRDRRGDPVG